MELQEDSGEDYDKYVHIFRKKGKKFWNANVRDLSQQKPNALSQQKPNTPANKPKQMKDDNEIAQQKITEIISLRKMELRCLRFTPNAFLVSLAQKEEAVFQELTPLGYYQANRCLGLTFEEAKLALSKVAEVHAAYLTYQYRPIDIQQRLREENRVYIVPDASKEIAYAAITAAKTYPPNFEKLREKVKNNVDKFDSKMRKVLIGCWTGNEVRVINHGDAWLNNFIFMQENGTLKDAMLLLSQLPRYGSPGLDLNFFLHTSLQVDVLKQHRKELLHSYHESLRLKMLSRHWFDPPSMDEILKEVHLSEFYSFYAVMCELPLVCLERDQCDRLSLHNLKDDAYVKKMCYNFFKCERVLETLEYTLERLDQLGVLDAND